ncbi:bifunctional adenosylcobinamide kinase/adenosylcobinamide-phosphate guanylyltransferase [Shimia ponticola]|uniref:bifunctional adenosylcobinamide kinase/adenosylcobinamide-phosphate guanylyltransferase n=1 Tax=Shimia ponticola TaxID=2582893 RepID=UPI0011BECDF6|nr:bifunctional adenosylcobinamide kinase/adenosylcobinamide-phosphate guanylyltransferase [Shimia ponticola]
MKKKLPNRTLVLGGASSGKSLWAENLTNSYNLPKHYIATAQAFDDEMRAKIDQHKQQRGPNWVTHEAPFDVAAVLSTIPSTDVVLLDCLTLWLSNQLLAETDLEKTCEALISAISACPAPIIMVSNEVGQGVVPESRLGRAFRSAQGRLNQQLATLCDPVVVVMAGLPLALKGELP